MSSGYGTLSVWETTGPPEQTTPPGVTEEVGRRRDDHHWSPTHQEDTETTLIGCEQSSANETTPKAESASPRPSLNQHGTSKSSSSQPLTSWAQRHKLRPKRSKAGPDLASPQPPEVQEPPPPSPADRDRDSPLDHTDLHNQHRPAAPSTYAFPLRRSDSLMSEASGLTYWRLDESELYRPLPDSFDSGAYLLLQDASVSMTEEHSRLSLREIYQSQKRTESRRSDWEGSLTPSPVSPQLLTPDPTVPPTRQSDRTSGFTSPSHFSSPSSFPPAQPRPPAAPGATAAAVSPGDTDCTSNASSLSGAAPSRAEPPRAPPSPASRTATQSPLIGRPRRGGAPLASEEEEGGRTHAPRARGPDLLGGETHSAPFGVGPPRAAAGPGAERAAALEDPVVVSLLRQNLREKHSRHVADLKAYYECEIRALRDKLSLRDLPRDLEKSNQALHERCEHLERALTEASGRIQELENNNCILEKQLADWPERYAVAGATVATLQRRLEESKRSGSEKDALAAHLRTRVRQLEEAAQNARGEADESHARREREYKMLQDLLGEYDSLRTDHEGLKNNLVSTESKIFDANEQISELKRVISKLESQVKQLEYENQARSRHAPHSHTQPSGAGLYHHPDLLLSASKHTQEENAYRSSPAPQSDQSNGGRKSNGYRKPPRLPADQSAGSDGSASSFSSASDSRRCSPPTVRDPAQETGGQSQEQAASLREPGRREGGPLTPLMRALIELEETRATESRAPWLSGRRPTVGFVERSHFDAVGERGRPTADVGGGAGPSGRGGASPEMRGPGPERGAAVLRARRSLSPEGHRSSSLPPQGQRPAPPATPTKRETLLLPLSAKSSPKRCPTENYSTAFGQPLPQQQQHLHNRFDVPLDQRRHSFHSASPRKRLHFTTPDRTEAPRQSCGGLAGTPGSAAPAERGPWLGWEQQGTGGAGPDLQEPGEDSVLWSLAEAERLFDELTHEKGQIEAALSRMPVAGGRLSLQTRLDEVALETRLETVNRELGCLRMTLKRFHVLRSSAHT